MSLFDEKSLETIRDTILKKNETLAVAESVSAGALQLAFSTVKDSSMFFQGGVTAYNLGQKFKHLHVEPIHAQACNCVSARVAAEMALHVFSLFESDWGVGITGYAAPAEEGDNQLFAYFAIVYKGKIVSEKKLKAKQEDSFQVQLYYSNRLLKEMAGHLKKI